ncbi:MAG: acetate--CoA ligase family protein [Candidatus Aenigmarchaeota archaeon]|nr:acetate--CoA ligase family protein [Candidatus Aenigmarchaeota archaeon]
MNPKEIFKTIKINKRNNLTELESREVLAYYGIPLVRGEVVKSIEEAKKFVERIGFPVVLKVVSPQIIHKTDVNGVILNIKNEKELFQAYHQIIKNIEKNAPKANIEGFFIQEMLSSDREVIVGGKYDPTFGQTIAFGLGGVFVEIFEDVSFRVVPITQEDAIDMIKEIKAFKILKGYRGQKPVDFKALVDILLKTSKMLEENPEIRELDINPIFALPDRAVAVDARIIIE